MPLPDSSGTGFPLTTRSEYDFFSLAIEVVILTLKWISFASCPTTLSLMYSELASPSALAFCSCTSTWRTSGYPHGVRDRLIRVLTLSDMLSGRDKVVTGSREVRESGSAVSGLTESATTSKERERDERRRPRESQRQRERQRWRRGAIPHFVLLLPHLPGHRPAAPHLFARPALLKNPYSCDSHFRSVMRVKCLTDVTSSPAPQGEHLH